VKEIAVQQQSGERAGMRGPGPDEWLFERARGGDGTSSGHEDALASPWAGALGPEDDPDGTTTFSAPYASSAQPAASDAGAPPASGQSRDWGLTTLRIGPRAAAGLSYVLGWVSGLIVYFNERENKYVRFHAVQSILLTSAMTIFGVLAYLASSLLTDIATSTHQVAFHQLGVAVGLLATFFIAILWLAPMIAAWSGEYLRLPIVSTYAERYADLPPQRSHD
jgi:uncharacterized membrane protein